MEPTVLDNENEAVKAERERVSQIHAACNEHSRELLAAGRADLAATAVNEGWDIGRVNGAILDAIRAARPAAPTITTTRGHDRPRGTKVLAAAALLAAGYQDAAEGAYDERTLQAAADLRAGCGLDIARECVREALGQAPSDRNEMLRAAFSTSELGRAMIDAGTAVSLLGYREVPQPWRLVARIVPVSDFREGKAIRPYTTDSLLDKVGPDGELKNTGLGEEAYLVKAETHGRIVGITRQTIVNDGGLGEVFEIERAVGRQAGRTLNRAVWLAMRDASNFYTEATGNDLSNNALGIDGLSAAVAAMREMTDDAGEPIGLEPGCLVVPPALEAIGRMLLNSTEVATGSELAAANPWLKLAELAVVPYLSTAAGGDDAKWYLTAKPSDSAGILVALLNGVDSPIIERVPTDAKYLGMQLRCYMDFGVGTADPKAIIRSAG